MSNPIRVNASRLSKRVLLKSCRLIFGKSVVPGALCLALLVISLSAVAETAFDALGLTKEICFSMREDNAPGSGTASDPFNASAGGLDTRLRELFSVSKAVNLHIRLLPGIYPTQGNLMWRPRSGWKIHGAGIDVTTLRLMNISNNVSAVVGTYANESQSNMEVCDLTVDCNYSPANPNKASAVSLSGSRNAIRRVKAVNAYGDPPVSETFVLAIGTGGLQSDGNVIEDCEVSSFKGSYCIAIGFGAPVGSTKYIGGIIRGNHVYDLRFTRGQSIGTAYGGGNMRDVIIENNFSERCDIAVNIDTGKSLNVIFRGNHFLGCKVRGIGLFGTELDNFVLEDNVIEVDFASRDFGIACGDQGGFYKLTNFKIRNNILRSMSGLNSPAGGIALSITKGDSFLVTGNRIESTLRNYFPSPGLVLFDNTDFSGKPIQITDGASAHPVNLPLGERGTLLLNRGNAYLMAETGSNPSANGANLISAYLQAKAMKPHGQALSATNRATVFLFPAKYALPDSALVLDTEFVDLVGLGDPKAIRLESEGNAVVQLANDVTLEHLTLHCSSTLPPQFGSNDKAAYFPDGLKAKTVIKDCLFTSANNGWGMRLGVNYQGFYENSTCGPRGWGGPGHFSGTAVHCSAGFFSFAAGGLFTGIATNCTAAEASFGGGGGAFQGFAKNCSAGHDSFGGPGTLFGCEITGAINSAVATTGQLKDCRVGPAPGNFSAIVIGEGASLQNCTFLANPGGSGFSIDAPAQVRAKIAHCRLNQGMRNVVNAIAQPFNVDDPNID